MRLFSVLFLLGDARVGHAFTSPFENQARHPLSGSLSATTVPDALASSNINKNENNSPNSVEFPPPLTQLDRLKRAATFWSTAVPIVAQYYGLLSKIKFQELTSNPLTESEIQQLWDAQHTKGATQLADTITELKGFYVKTAQIISSRRDLFPEQYTEALSGFTDNLDPMPAALAKAVIESELLHADEKFEDVFAEFDEKPLGAASVAQCHRAVLTEKYGGKTVAVKIQRPSIVSHFLRCSHCASCWWETCPFSLTSIHSNRNQNSWEILKTSLPDPWKKRFLRFPESKE